MITRRKFLGAGMLAMFAPLLSKYLPKTEHLERVPLSPDFMLDADSEVPLLKNQQSEKLAGQKFHFERGFRPRTGTLAELQPTLEFGDVLDVKFRMRHETVFYLTSPPRFMMLSMHWEPARPFVLRNLSVPATLCGSSMLKGSDHRGA